MLRANITALRVKIEQNKEKKYFSVEDEDFDEKVLKSLIPVIVLFAAWSGPSRAFTPVFEKLSSKYYGRYGLQNWI